MSYRNNNYQQQPQQTFNGNYGGYPQSFPSYGQQPQQYGYQQQRPAPKKHSGAKKTLYTPTKGANAGHQQIHVHGWRYRKQGGLSTFSCNTTHKSQDAGKGWVGSVAVEAVNQSTGQKSFYWATMQVKTGKVVIKELGLVINPAARNGGYCGTFIKK